MCLTHLPRHPRHPCLPALQRGKDGHLTLNAKGGDDFFSNPLGSGNLGSPSARQNSLGECACMRVHALHRQLRVLPLWHPCC